MPFEFGPFSISGSNVTINGSLSTSGSIIVSGSFNIASGSLIYLPFSSGSATTSSLGYLTGSSIGTPFLYVINGILYCYNGSTWNKIYP